MADSRWDQTKAIFGEAVELQGGEREAYLARSCVGEADLRARVERLLMAEEQAAGFLGGPTLTGKAGEGRGPVRGLDGDGGERIGERIGAYRLLELIGHGGFGAVYMAEQEQPVRRRVALKVLKPGMDSRQVVARFEAERQALALMDHPGIARVFEAGTGAGGRPYFAMELVRGVPITEYCDTHALRTAERLALFVQVCHAVQHAHHKGVIHRDLKPSNVLVTNVDGLPQPKVIDFGIAKATATAAPLTDKTLVTGFRGLVGTPAYMSPEQADTAGEDIDTRSDVYSLGVLLYELLVGVTPLDGRALSNASLPEVLRVIREVEPPRPSTRVTAAEMGGAEGAAQRRRTDAHSLVAQLKGDLDWICLKCLEKQRSRRYSSASELAADIERTLKHEPILARPPGVVYRAGKFARRHRVLVTAGVIAIVAGGAGLAAALAGYFEANRQRDLARGAAGLEATARAAAETNLVAAEKEKRKARAVQAFMQRVFEQADPETGTGRRDITVAEALDRAAAQLDAGKLKDDPAVEAAVRKSIGRTYRSIGQLQKAEPQLKAAADWVIANPDDTDYEDTINALAVLYDEIDKQGEVEPLMRMVMARLVARHGEEHADVATAMNNLAGTIANLGKGAEAEKLYRRAIEIREVVIGSNAPENAVTWNNLGALLFAVDRKGEAIECFERSVGVQRAGAAAGGVNEVSVAQTLANIGFLLDDAGRYREAEEKLREAIGIMQRVFAGDHARISIGLFNLARTLRSQGKIEEAIDASAEGLAMRRRLFATGNPDLIAAIVSHGVQLLNGGRAADGEPLLREALDARRLVEKQAGMGLAENLLHLGEALVEQGKGVEAEAVLRESLQVREGLKAAGWRSAWAKTLLGRSLRQQERFTEARAALEEGAMGLVDASAPKEKAAAAKEWAAECCERVGDAAGAARWRQDGVPGGGR